MASQIAACALGLKIDTAEMTLDEQVQRVMNAWQAPMPRLLIFDNCEDYAILEQWKPRVGGCRVLVTARSDQWPMLTQIRLGLLSPEESRRLLQRLCARLSNTEADAIATDLGYLPLALHLAGSYLEAYAHHTVEHYRKDLTIAHRSLKGRGALPSPTRHEQDVEATFMLSLTSLIPTMPLMPWHSACSMARRGVCRVCRFLAIWCWRWFHLRRIAMMPLMRLKRLQQFGLLDGTDAVVVHRLVAQVIQARLGSTEMLGIVEESVAMMAERLNPTGIPSATIALEPHLRYVTLCALEHGRAAAARLGTVLGIADHIGGRYAAAYRLFEQVFVLRTHTLGSEHLATMKSLNNMAVVLERQGQYAAAQPWFEQVLMVRERELGRDHPETIHSMNNVATVLLNQGADVAARSLFEHVLAFRQRMEPTNHAAIATSMQNLATVVLRQGDATMAQELYAQALALREDLFGGMHPQTAESMNGVATAALQQGLLTIAHTWYKRAVMVREQTLGMDNPETATSLNGLGVVFERQGKLVDARTCYARAVAIRERTLGIDHPNTQLVVGNLQRVIA